MATVARVGVLILVDLLAVYAMYIMMAYLTDVWKLGFTRAAAIVNVFWGLTALLPLPQAFLVDTIMGHYWMLLISSFSYSVGLGLLTMSTPPVLARITGTCSEYKPECIGEPQKVLFYIALPLTAFGFAGHFTCLNKFLAKQLGEDDEDYDEFASNVTRLMHKIIARQLKDEEDYDEIMMMRLGCTMTGVGVFTVIAVLGLPYIKPWSLRFGIPAICTLVATLLFFSGSWSYDNVRTKGSPLMTFFRVLVAALSKLFYTIPRDANELFEIQGFRVDYDFVPHTQSMRCLDKAAIVIPTKSVDDQKENKWRMCRVTEVEETKTIIRMIPVWMTFILCGIVSAIGFTYFVEQLNHMNPKVGRLKVPIPVLLWFYGQAHGQFAGYYVQFARRLGQRSRKWAPSVGIAISMVLAILCCITAAKVEDRRLGVVRKHGLVRKPEETVPMTMFWLLPQFILLGAFTGSFSNSAIFFFIEQSPVSTRRYLPLFINGVGGVGIIGSVVSVYVVGKMSERGGKMNWFQHDLNGSRLDKYYWTLAWLMAINLVLFMVVAMFYRYKESELEDEEALNFGGIDELYEDDPKCFCSSCLCLCCCCCCCC